MAALTFYFSKTKIMPRRHRPIKVSGEIVGYIRVVRSTGRVNADMAFDRAQPMRGESLLNTVDI